VNIEEYISSGILEAYVLGTLSDIEQAAVEKNIAQYPELQSELASIEAVNEKLLMKAAIAPKASVKTALFNKIEARKSTSDSGNVVELNPAKQNDFWKFAAAASVTVAIIASIVAYNYWSKWKNVSTQLIALTTQQQKIASDYNQVNFKLDKLEGDMRVLNDPQFKRVIMKGTANAPEAMASVYWNESTKEVFLNIQNMKALSRENQYQLWAIIDGKPVDAGVFDGDVAGLVKMRSIGKGAATFAVTIEPRGGKPSPSLETMQVAGNVDKV
jgi:anti-sigma-K factor RskA